MKYLFTYIFLFISLSLFSMQVSWTKPVKYANGYEPSIICLSDKFVLEVHQTNDNYNSELTYSKGMLNPSTNIITWVKGLKYGIGQNPSLVYLGKNDFIELHQQLNKKNDKIPDLYYNYGSFNPSTKVITWEESKQYGTGTQPVATYIGKNKILELHSDQTDYAALGILSNNFRYRIGTIEEKKRIKWSGLNLYGNGYNPTIAYLDDNILLGVNAIGNDQQFFQTGIFNSDGDTITFVNSGNLNTGSSIFSPYDGGSSLIYLGNNSILVVCSSDSYVENIEGIDAGSPGNTSGNYGLYLLGTINRKNNKIEWSAPLYYNEGYSLSISSMNSDKIIEVHVDSNLEFSGLFYQIATINDSSNPKDNLPIQKPVKQHKLLTSEELIKKINKQLGLINNKQDN